MTVTLLVLRVLAPLSAFLALFTGFGTLLHVPSAESSYLGLRGLRRVRSLRENALWAKVEPLVRWIGTRLRPLLSERVHQRLDREITLAGDLLGLTPEELVALGLLSVLGWAAAAAACTVGIQKNTTLYIPLGAALGLVLPYVSVTSIQQERRKRVQDALPHAIDLLSLALSAGLDFPGALRQVIEKTSNPSDPLIEELNVISYELSMGKTRKQALAQFSERVPSESVHEFVASVSQSEERGNPLAEVLAIQAEASRQHRSVRAEEAASKASVKMFGPILIIFIVVMLLVLAPLLMSLDQTFSDK